ncbi:MAG: Hsp70 family protein [Bacteroidales bacterium]|nr:Hsp70 family protein [Bacteroidales bacterium]
MNCPKCNKEVSSEWKLCPFCGFEPKKCSNPECPPRWLPQEAKYCPVCGAQLEKQDVGLATKTLNYERDIIADDVKSVIVEWLADEFKIDYNVDLRKDEMALWRLKMAAEKAKNELLSSDSVEIFLPYIWPVEGVPQHLCRTLTRDMFSRLLFK